MYIISVSYGNDSIALLQWAKEKNINDVYVVYVDTGWAHPDWKLRVSDGMRFAESLGFTTWIIDNHLKFSEWVIIKKMFPTNKHQWCTTYLKIIPFGNFLEFIDPHKKATIIVGKRRAESKKRELTNEYETNNKFYNGQTVWNPLFLHSDKERDDLIIKTGLEVFNHRSMECCPCVNANRQDLRETPQQRIDVVRKLEEITGKTFYSETRFMGASGIDEVVAWANSARGKYNPKQLNIFECSSGFCGI